MGKYPCGLFLLGKCPNMGDSSGCRRGPHDKDLAPFCEAWARGECTGCYRRHYYLPEDNKLVAIKTEPQEALGVELSEDNEVSLRFVVDFETGKRSFRSEHENTETLVSTENVRIYEYEVKNKAGSEVGGKLNCSSDSRVNSCRDSNRSDDSTPRGRKEDRKDDNMNKSRKDNILKGVEEGEKKNKYKEDNRKSSDTITDRKEGRKRYQQKEKNRKMDYLRKRSNVGSPRVELTMDMKKDAKPSSCSKLPPPLPSRNKHNANFEELGRRRRYSKPCDVPDVSGGADNYNPTSMLKLFLGKEEERLRNVKILRGQEEVRKSSYSGCAEGVRKVCDNMEEDRKIIKTRSIKRKISEDMRDRIKDRKFPKISENQDSIKRDDQIRDRSRDKKVRKYRSRDRKVSKDQNKGNDLISKDRSRDSKTSRNPSWDRKISENGYKEKKTSEDRRRDRPISADHSHGRKISKNHSGEWKSSEDTTGIETGFLSKRPPPSMGMDLSKNNANMEDLGPRRSSLKSNRYNDNSGGADGYNPTSLLKSALARNGKRR